MKPSQIGRSISSCKIQIEDLKIAGNDSGQSEIFNLQSAIP